jgi:hypothetical protein
VASDLNFGTPLDSTLCLSNAESAKTLDRFDICSVTNVGTVMEVVKVGTKRVEQLMVQRVFHGMT